MVNWFSTFFFPLRKISTPCKMTYLLTFILLLWEREFKFSINTVYFFFPFLSYLSFNHQNDGRKWICFESSRLYTQLHKQLLTKTNNKECRLPNEDWWITSVTSSCQVWSLHVLVEIYFPYMQRTFIWKNNNRGKHWKLKK